MNKRNGGTEDHRKRGNHASFFPPNGFLSSSVSPLLLFNLLSA